MALFDDIDAGDETRRDGDHISFPHPDDEGDALSSVTIDRGVPVTYDGTSLSEATASASDIVGILQNYDVSGDTGSEVVGPEATVGTQGAYKADLSGGIGVSEGDGGTVHGNNGELLIVEVIDAANDIAEVVVR